LSGKEARLFGVLEARGTQNQDCVFNMMDTNILLI